MKYLHIFEDGELLEDDSDPSQDDVDSIKAGILAVIKFEDGMFLELLANGTWADLERE